MEYSWSNMFWACTYFSIAIASDMNKKIPDNRNLKKGKK